MMNYNNVINIYNFHFIKQKYKLITLIFTKGYKYQYNL